MKLTRIPAALALAGALLLSGCGGSHGATVTGHLDAAASSSAPAPSTTAQTGQVSLHGNGGTVLSAMDDEHVRYEVKGSGESAFVTSINGVAADDSKQQYWSLYVNDQQAQTGAGTATAAPSDTITWKLETY
jgi:hypothetical protein